MRYLAIGAVTVLAIAATSCSKPKKPPPAAPFCPPNSPYHGPTLPSVSYTLNMVVVGSTLKPAPQAVSQDKPGLCVDGTTGDLHLYHQDTRQVVLTLVINTLNGHWNENPDYAFETDPNALFGQSVESPDHASLAVNLRAHDNGKRYPYTAYYVAPNGDVVATEPGIINH